MDNKLYEKLASLEKVAIGDTEEGRSLVRDAIRLRRARIAQEKWIQETPGAPIPQSLADYNNSLHDRLGVGAAKISPQRYVDSPDAVNVYKDGPFTVTVGGKKINSRDDFFKDSVSGDGVRSSRARYVDPKYALNVDWSNRDAYYKGKPRVGTPEAVARVNSVGAVPTGTPSNLPVPTSAPTSGNFLTKNKKLLLGGAALTAGAAGLGYLYNKNKQKAQQAKQVVKTSALEKVAIGDTEEGRRAIEQAYRNRIDRLNFIAESMPAPEDIIDRLNIKQNRADVAVEYAKRRTAYLKNHALDPEKVVVINPDRYLREGLSKRKTVVSYGMKPYIETVTPGGVPIKKFKSGDILIPMRGSKIDLSDYKLNWGDTNWIFPHKSKVNTKRVEHLILGKGGISPNEREGVAQTISDILKIRKHKLGEERVYRASMPDIEDATIISDSVSGSNNNLLRNKKLLRNAAIGGAALIGAGLLYKHLKDNADEQRIKTSALALPPGASSLGAQGSPFASKLRDYAGMAGSKLRAVGSRISEATKDDPFRAIGTSLMIGSAINGLASKKEKPHPVYNINIGSEWIPPQYIPREKSAGAISEALKEGGKRVGTAVVSAASKNPKTALTAIGAASFGLGSYLGGKAGSTYTHLRDRYHQSKITPED